MTSKTVNYRTAEPWQIKVTGLTRGLPIGVTKYHKEKYPAVCINGQWIVFCKGKYLLYQRTLFIDKFLSKSVDTLKT